MVREVLASDPDDPHAVAVLALCVHRLGRYDELVAISERLIALDPDSFVGYAMLSSGLGNDRRFAEAVEPARTAVRLRPDDASVQAGLAEALAMTGQGAEAVRAAVEAVRLAPDDPGVMEIWGFVLAKTERWGEAVAPLAAAVGKDPLNAQHRFRLGCVLLRLGRYDEVREQWSAMLAAEPSERNVRWVHDELVTELVPAPLAGLFQQACLALHGEELDIPAVREYALGRLLEENPAAAHRVVERLTSPDALLLRALVRKHDGEHEEAAELLVRAHAEGCRSDALYQAAMVSCLRAGAFADGARLAEEAVGLFPDVPAYLWFHAKYLLALGEVEAARPLAARYARLEPGAEADELVAELG
ncbi:tetratricopeptide repeat protein [Labedaea rhizosphaerae]|uniref:Tetratricopeptide repeat protein n=2 Tax=Labedaea rhizosphaerae TaxID=598644 RepID=A0A4R6SPF2_LABRH|nr:tetratricopeptide repeat protein [Labedaea rhizosphaerae]